MGVESCRVRGMPHMEQTQLLFFPFSIQQVMGPVSPLPSTFFSLKLKGSCHQQSIILEGNKHLQFSQGHTLVFFVLTLYKLYKLILCLEAWSISYLVCDKLWFTTLLIGTGASFVTSRSDAIIIWIHYIGTVVGCTADGLVWINLYYVICWHMNFLTHKFYCILPVF